MPALQSRGTPLDPKQSIGAIVPREAGNWRSYIPIFPVARIHRDCSRLTIWRALPNPCFAPTSESVARARRIHHFIKSAADVVCFSKSVDPLPARDGLGRILSMDLHPVEWTVNDVIFEGGRNFMELGGMPRVNESQSADNSVEVE